MPFVQSGAKRATLVIFSQSVYDSPIVAGTKTPQMSGGKTVPVQIRKLSSDEAAKVFPKRGQMDLSEYTDALRELQPGDAAEIELGSPSRRALKRRLGAAAKETGYSGKRARDGGTRVLRMRVSGGRRTPANA